MCGIVGIVGRSVVERRLLEAMATELRHRGPDSAGCWIDSPKQVGLAHRRLSIIDLSSAGHQPMEDGNELAVLTYNGEIYNYIELRDELESLGHHFRSRTDTEVLLRAYLHWGRDFLAKLNGMFAFALYDRRTGDLLLARDRFGEKPLYFYRTPGLFIFASELKAITVHPSFSAQVDQEALFYYFSAGYIPAPHSIYCNTQKLLPAHYLVLNTRSLEYSINRYWKIDSAQYRSDRGVIGRESALDEADSLLQDSVTRRMIADVPVGAFLSGGIDSSLIVAYMARARGQVKSYTIGFEEGSFDEAPYAKKIAAHLGTDHHEYYISSKSMRDVLRDLVDVYDEPFADVSALPMYLVSRYARNDVKVVLSGDGGDELFAGYTTYPRFSAMAKLWEWPCFFRKGAKAFCNSLGTRAMHRHSQVLSCRQLWEVFFYLNERMPLKRPDVRNLLPSISEDLWQSSPFASAFQKWEPLVTPVEAACHADIETYLAEDILTKVDRASMAVSLETRVPFLDFRLAEWAMALSPELKVGQLGMKRKLILHQLLERYVPLSLFERPKRGFSPPIARWLREELNQMLAEYLNRDRLASQKIFDIYVVERFIYEHVNNIRDRESILWALIFWEMWRERHAIS